MLNLKPHFSHFLHGKADHLHFAAHSHHYWPDCTFAAQEQCWRDAARLVDDKWGHIFETVIPEAQAHIAKILALPNANSIVFAPNTHEFVVRLRSAIDGKARVLCTDSEFHSFSRQAKRWVEEGSIDLVTVAAEPFLSFPERMLAAVREGSFDMIFLSHVFFNSGYTHSVYEQIAEEIDTQKTMLVLDGYHGFMARPTSLEKVADKCFYLAGGYKYAMGGEGVCFLHAPEGVAERPVNTGWFAGFGSLSGANAGQVGYSENGMRLAGATFDPAGLYRFNAVQRWLAELEVDVGAIHNHVHALQEAFISGLEVNGDKLHEALGERLVVDGPRGHFLSFRTNQAEALHQKLAEFGVATDFRGDRLRFGFAIYHDLADVEKLLERVGQLR